MFEFLPASSVLMMKHRFLTAFLIPLSLTSATVVDFEKEILPILEKTVLIATAPRSRNLTSVYDFNAKILHLLGLDHERLSYYHNGLERRLTNVHGHVIHDIIA